MPGVSEKTIWKSSPLTMPRMRWRVVCAATAESDWPAVAALAGGLRLGGDDGEFLAHQCVHQRRLPDVGISDDIDKARFVHEMRFIRVQSYDKFEKIPYVCKSYSLKSYCLWRNNGDISGCRRSFLRKSRADGRIESISMCCHRTKSAGTKHIKVHRLFFLHSELGHF